MASADKEAFDAMAADWARDHDRLTAERDRLREALERIADGEYDLHRADSFASEAKQIAREALSRPEDKRG